MSVLEAPPPRFSEDAVASLAAELFGLNGVVTNLGSERDQTFLIDEGVGDGGVLKISNLGEDPAVLDFENDAILHALRVDPGLPLARPLRERTTVDGADGTHHVRLFQRMRGHVGGSELDDGAVRDFTATLARLNLALRGFFHPAAGRELLWDLKHASGLRALLPSIADQRRRALVADAIDRFEERVLPRWMLLRSQVVHGDFNLDNVLLDDRDRVAGIVDFGDCGYTAQVADLAIAVASLLRGRHADDVFRIARIAIDGYTSRVPLETVELDVLADLVATRLAAIVSISAWRVARYPENAEYIQAWDADSWELLEFFAEVGADRATAAFGGGSSLMRTHELAAQRRRLLGAALTDLTYGDPVHVVRGEGVWLFDADGRRLLDGYNNVPVVGHCHPRVTEAVVRQTRTLNTHARYLYESLVELAEHLKASMPPGLGLDTVMLVNSGSEANELAWRLATATTGNTRAVVTEHAYHGVTTAIADISPEEWAHGYHAANTHLISPLHLDEPLDDGVAATFVDCGFTSDGVQTPSREDLASLVEHTHAAGGLFVADEVQAGHGRGGDHLWMFESYGLAPDLVTLGKPMGNGYPVAAVVGRKEIFDRFAEQMRVFSTFGGNPVAARAALAVLDVIEDERLVENAGRVGRYLREQLEPFGFPVRGRGLLVGVELPSAADAERVVNAMRADGVLIGRTGRGDNVLKIRPPLVFREEHADLLVASLERAVNR